MAEVIKLSIENILNPKISHRTHDIEAEHIKTLANAMEEFGQETPIWVLDNGDGSYTLNDGHRRFTATELLYEEDRNAKGVESGEILVIVKGMTADFDDKEQLLMQMRGNAHTVASTSQDYISSMYILGREGMTMLEIADALKISKSTVYSWAKAIRLPKEVKELVQDGSIAIGKVAPLVEVKSKVPAEKFAELVEVAQTETLDILKEEIEEILLVVADEKEAQKANADGKSVPKSEPVFVPKMVVKAKADLTAILNGIKTDFDADPSEVNTARLTVINNVLSLNEKDVAEAKAAWELNQEKTAEKKLLKEKELILKRQKADADRLKELNS